MSTTRFVFVDCLSVGPSVVVSNSIERPVSTTTSSVLLIVESVDEGETVIRLRLVVGVVPTPPLRRNESKVLRRVSSNLYGLTTKESSWSIMILISMLLFDFILKINLFPIAANNPRVSMSSNLINVLFTESNLCAK